MENNLGLRGSGFDSSIDLQIDVDSPTLYKLHYCLVAVAAEFMFRFWIQYTQFPWVLARLADERIAIEQRSELAASFFNKSTCCLDKGCSLFLQCDMNGPDDLLPGGAHYATIDVLTIQKVMNIEVEDNFSRAARARATTQGDQTLNKQSVQVTCFNSLRCLIYIPYSLFDVQFPTPTGTLKRKTHTFTVYHITSLRTWNV